MTSRSKVLLADDHQLVLDGLALIIDGATDFEVVGQVSNGADAIDFVHQAAVDVILMDINMPEVNGIEATKIIKKSQPMIKILGLSMLDEIQVIKNFRKSGGDGFMLKNSGKEDILLALTNIVNGKAHYDPHILEQLMSPDLKVSPAMPSLSRREREILALIVQEHTTKEIAEKLFISFGTVETHRRNMINKLGVRNTAGLVRVAMEYGLLE